MKLIYLLGLLSFSQIALADFVYMQEDKDGKSVILQTNEGSSTSVINESAKEWAIYPDISADGEEFVYVEGADASDLHLTYKNPKKNILQRFHLAQKGMLLHPKFSKNGKFIFYSAPGPQGKNTVYFFNRAEIVKSQGENLVDYSLKDVTALDATEESYFPRPSSDANFVVYQRNTNGVKEIVLFDRLENKKTVMAEGMSPALSFDERWIAYTSKVNGNWDVFMKERALGTVVQVTSDEKDEMAPTFMPDNTVVFASNKTGNFNLYKTVHGEWLPLLHSSMTVKGTDFYSPQFSGETQFAQDLKAPFIGNARSSFGTVMHQGKLYMAGGHQGAEHTYPPESFTDTFIVYDPMTNKWTELAPRPRKAHGFQVAANGNYIYAFGGFAFSAEHKPRWKSLTEIDRYDIKNNKWETIGNLKSPRSSNVAVTIDMKVYIAGGWDSTPKKENDLEGTFQDTIEVFDLTTEKIQLAPYKLPNPLRRAFTGIEYNGKIVLIGGLGQGSSHFDLLQNVTSIDPYTGVSTELAKLPFATFAPAAEVLNNELFVFGGMFKMGEMSYEYVSHIYGMDLTTKQWRHTGRSLKETKGFSQVFGLDDKTLGILGGHHYFEGYDSPVTTFETFSTK